MMNENEFSDGEEEYSEEIPVEEVLSEFTLLENDYKHVMEQMQDNEELAVFGNEYSKLFEAFSFAYNNGKELVEKCETLEHTIQQYKNQCEQLESFSVNDHSTIEDLKRQLENALRLTDNAHTREQAAEEVIVNMRSQVVKLNTELELKNRMGEDQGDEASKTKEGFEREKIRMLEEIQMLKQKVSNTTSYVEELEHKNSLADLRQQELHTTIEQHLMEEAKLQRGLEKAEGETKECKEKDEAKQEEINRLNEVNAEAQSNLMKMERKLEETKSELAKTKKSLDELIIENEKCLSDFETLQENFAEMEENFIATNQKLEDTETEMSQLNATHIKLFKQYELLKRKFNHLETAKKAADLEFNKLRTTSDMLEKEVYSLKRENNFAKRTNDNLEREKGIMQKNIIRIQGVVQQHLNLIAIQEKSQLKLEADMNAMKREAIVQKRELFNMEKDRNRAIEESLDLAQKVEDAMDEIKLKQQDLFEHKKIIAEAETRLRQQQTLFDTIRADRNAFQKALQESTAECDQLKNKLIISNHQTEQLKEDISAKESLLIKEENILRKLNKEKENLKVEVQRGLEHIHSLKKEIAEMKENDKKLYKVISDNDATIKHQDTDLEQIMKDRDVIGAQLVRRNDELALLYEKVNILQITLERGETQYEHRLDDIRLLKLEITRLRQEKSLLSKSIANMTDLKHEVFQLERELAEERLKVRALEEELQHPLNIHRWRKLEGTDPDIVDLLQKIQILQKRLLKLTAESLEREKQLKEAERLYLNLRNVLSRQPGPDVKTELCKTQRALAIRGSKMKCLVSEVNMFETQAAEYKMDLEKVTNELREVKLKYMREKKINQRHLAEGHKTPVLEAGLSNQTVKYAGGGFKMAPVSN